MGVCYTRFNKLHSIFGLQNDSIDPDQLRGVVYEVLCSDCSHIHVGQTKNSCELDSDNTDCVAICNVKIQSSWNTTIDLNYRIDWAKGRRKVSTPVSGDSNLCKKFRINRPFINNDALLTVDEQKEIIL